MKLELIIVVFGGFTLIKPYSAVHIPSYIKTCSRQDLNFNNCLLKNGNEAIPSVVKGDSTIHVPVLDPLYLELISLEASRNLRVYLKNSTIYGLKSATLLDGSWDFDKKNVRLLLHFPFVSLDGFYKIKGTLLLLKLEGEGAAHFNYTHTNVSVNIHYDLITKSGKEFAKLRKLTCDTNVQNINLYLANLLNNENVSKQMNSFLNENWREFFKEIRESVNQLIEQIIQAIIEPLLDRIQFNDIAPP